jgi:hypothetical protein
MNERPQIRRAQAYAAGAREAVRAFHAAVAQPDMALVVFFCSSDYDLDALADEMARSFTGIEVVGCTTAGEIGPAGYRDHSISGASFPAGDFAAIAGLVPDLRQFDLGQGQRFVRKLLQDLVARAPQASPDNSFGFLMIDGLSACEESVARILQYALGKIPLVGGSAGDALRFGTTRVYRDGRFCNDAAVFVLLSTPLPFKPFMMQHFRAAEQRLVVTAADVGNRVVNELDGRPAAQAYADLIGVSVAELDPARFAASPMVVVIGGTNYVHSISKVTDAGGLKFFCAIDEGVVLRVAHGTDLARDLEQALAALRDAVGEPQLVIGCDCILRRLEAARSGAADRVQQLLRRGHVVGFCTYGEQYRGMHVNQTFTGIAIGGGTAETGDA